MAVLQIRGFLFRFTLILKYVLCLGFLCKMHLCYVKTCPDLEKNLTSLQVPRPPSTANNEMLAMIKTVVNLQVVK